MMKFSGRQVSLLVVSGILSGTAFGAGFSLNEQSARSLGQAFSGRASDADTAATLVGNPAGMSLLKQAEFTGGFALIDAHSDIKNANGTVGGATISGSNDGDMVPLTAVPFGYYVQPLDPHWAVGFGIYVPFGLTTHYENGFQGRYFGTKSHLQVVTAQPTASYKLDNGLSFGAGVTFNRINGNLNKNIYNPINPNSDVVAKATADDTAWGYNLGVLYEFNANTRVGLTYYSQVKYTLEGHTTIENIPTLLNIGTAQRYKASLDLTTPDKIDLGLTHAFTPELALHADITQTRWSKLKEIRVENENAPTTPADLSSSTESLKWDNSWFYALGLTYQLDQQWLLRGGIAYDESPIPDSTRSVRVPTADRKIFAIGTTWSPMNNVSVDFSYLYFKEKSASVNRSDTALVTGSPINYSAKYDNYANIFGVQINWKI